MGFSRPRDQTQVSHTAVRLPSEPPVTPESNYLSMARILSSQVLVAQLCQTLCNTMDCSLPGYSVHGILQARVLEWVAIPFSRESSQLRGQTWISHIVSRFFTLSHQGSPLSSQSYPILWLRIEIQRLPLVVQWLKLCTPNAGGLDSNSDQGTRPHAVTQSLFSCCK